MAKSMRTPQHVCFFKDSISDIVPYCVITFTLLGRLFSRFGNMTAGICSFSHTAVIRGNLGHI